MFNVLFVGDKPSAKNTDPEIAFEGTKSGERLREWIALMRLDSEYCVFINRTDASFEALARSHYEARMPIVGVGREASKALMALAIPHFPLPHPSGLNRKLNDPKYIRSCLKNCERFLLGKRGLSKFTSARPVR